MTTLPEAEIQLVRRFAVRSLMATGATRAEAEAAVSEELRYALTRDLAQFELLAAAVCESLAEQFHEALRAWTPIMRSVSASWSRIHMEILHGGGPCGCPSVFGVQVDHGQRAQFQDVIAEKRRGAGSGPPPPRMDGRRRRDYGRAI